MNIIKKYIDVDDFQQLLPKELEVDFEDWLGNQESPLIILDNLSEDLEIYEDDLLDFVLEHYPEFLNDDETLVLVNQWAV